MKPITVALMGIALMACSSTPQLTQQKALRLNTMSELLPAAQKVLLPTQQRMEDGHVDLLFLAGEAAPADLSAWQETLSRQLHLPVELHWQQRQQQGYTLQVSVELQPESCRYTAAQTVSAAECRRIRREQMVMVKPEHYRNGQPLIVRESILEVGAVERLRAGEVRLTEEADKITDGAGGSGGD